MSVIPPKRRTAELLIGVLPILIKEWERRALQKLNDAQYEPDKAGKRLIEHGAMCYFNCAVELRDVMVEAAKPGVVA